eukprot:8446010-Alexandrium_andersonii.AAC.1
MSLLNSAHQLCLKPEACQLRNDRLFHQLRVRERFTWAVPSRVVATRPHACQCPGREEARGGEW